MFDQAQLDFANGSAKDTLVERLGIRFVPGNAGTLTATMPVDHRTLQPMGLLHGGATAALAETLGSMGSAMLVDRNIHDVVGVEVSANHLRAVRSGSVTAVGTLLHQGRKMHVWDIRVSNDAGELVASCRLTNMVIDKR